MNFVALIVASVLLFLSGLHVYWSFGGLWGSAAVVPTKANSNAQLFEPSPFATLVVALALLTAALVVLLRAEIFPLPLPSWTAQIGAWVIAAVFLLRATGDFRYVGFFKKVRNTAFARMDSRLYSPLCLALALLTLIVAL